jgi:hypothetical protein
MPNKLLKGFPGIVSGLFQQVKPDPNFIYFNYYELCGNICDKNGKLIKFNYLTKRKPKYGNYDYVIRELEPKRIYLYPINEISTETNCITGKPKTMHHNCIALDRRVICAGSIEFLPRSRNVKISNYSGHYLPNKDCLDYFEYLLNNLGYNVIQRLYF